MSNENPEDAENRQDFNLLKRQLTTSAVKSRSPTPSTTSTVSSDNSSPSANLWPLQLNTTQLIDHYILGETIGTGSYADVRECIDTRTLERCAVKIVNKHYLKRQNPSALLNQKQEIRLLRRLSHPNVIIMRECLSKGPMIYIVLEHCTFVLDDLLNLQPNNKFCISITRNLFQQLITGINYIHSQGIIHRDVKPQNLLLTTSGVLKIIDFGVSQILSMWDQQDLCSNYEGSPLFQAPEVISGQQEYHGYKVDVWSAGITLYLMLFGQYPFIDTSLLGLYDKILGEELTIPPNTCAIVYDLLVGMLDKDSNNRLTIDMILHHPWLQFQYSTQGEYDPRCELIELTHWFCDDNTISRKDVYKSMSVLPYLHNYHFPNLVTRKAAKRESVSQPSSEPSSSSSGSSSSSSKSVSPSASPVANEIDSTNNPHEMITDQPIEWGTENQYNLLKVPLIRANRLKQSTLPGGRRRRRRRQREFHK